jgi:hypothetical protein
MQDASDSNPPRYPRLPVVLTAEDIFLFIEGGSPTSGHTHEALSVDELVEHGQQVARRHLTREKAAVLDAQLNDPDSWVNRALRMMQERSEYIEKVDWVRAMSGAARQEHVPDTHLKRGDPRVATNQELIVRFVRDAAGQGNLSEEKAERILAEAGESMSWIDSVPDRLITNEPIAPIRGSGTERRKYLATYYPVLADLMAEQNGHMCQRLAVASPELSESLQKQLAAAENRGGPEGRS